MSGRYAITCLKPLKGLEDWESSCRVMWCYARWRKIMLHAELKCQRQLCVSVLLCFCDTMVRAQIYLLIVCSDPSMPAYNSRMNYTSQAYLLALMCHTWTAPKAEVSVTCSPFFKWFIVSTSHTQIINRTYLNFLVILETVVVECFPCVYLKFRLHSPSCNWRYKIVKKTFV